MKLKIKTSLLLYLCFTITFLISCEESNNSNNESNNNTVIVTIYPLSCSNGILDGGELEIDCGGICQDCSTLEDTKDGQIYPTVKIGNQRWMAANLNYNNDLSNCYDNIPNMCSDYGRLYDFDREMLSTLCPNSWRLPTKADLEELMASYNNGEEAFSSLIEGGESGFNVLLAGYSETRGIGRHLDSATILWSSSELNINTNYSFNLWLGLDYNTPEARITHWRNQAYCRCMRNVQ